MESHLLTQACVFHKNSLRLVMANAPNHTSRNVNSWLLQYVPNQIPWPSQSPDFNRIENLFGWVKQELIILGPRTNPELNEKLESTWNRIGRGFLRPYREYMVRRCQMTIDTMDIPLNIYLSRYVVFHLYPNKE